MRWFRTKSHLCRELEVQAIREFIESEKGKTEEERAERLANDAAWMAALTAETPPLSPPPLAPSSSCCSSEADRKERVHAEEEQAQVTSCPTVTLTHTTCVFALLRFYLIFLLRSAVMWCTRCFEGRQFSHVL